MFSRRLKTGYLVIEGLNSFATVYFFYYLYFFMQKQHGFGNQANLMLAALNGASYALFAWLAGRFAQRYGYFTALKLGFGLMFAAEAVGSQMGTATGHVVVMVFGILGMSFTWPTLEALVSEGESPAGLQHMVGLYNVVWASTGAIGSFVGGAMLDRLGLQSLFYVPMAIQLTQLALTFWLEAQARAAHVGGSHSHGPDQRHLPATAAASGTTAKPHTAEGAGETEAAARSRTFQRLAWLANPFAYIALNTLIAVMPGVALRLGLSTTLAGFFCSAWCFARLGCFWSLWLWNGWHYRFRWLLVAYLALVASFSSILLAPNLAILVGAQIFFGGAIGLIYYSSLYYSMDASDTKGEHGGIHESAIGLGNFAGPAVGAAALQFLPQYSHSGALAVSLLLLCGLGGLTAIWRSGRTP
jgi:predicted MFS family arabinose efflux permease